MKIFATLAVLALATNYAAAECNNMCSGHGECGANDQCTCYRNWRGNDCSERTCQYGVAFIDTAQGDLDHDGLVTDDKPYSSGTVNNQATKTQWAPSSTGGTFEERFIGFVSEEAHAYMECSNKGMCDRSSGECVCFDGYEGSACQRTVCHNSCSGHGICRNIVDKSNSLSATAKTDYQLWDGLKNQACVCDPGYAGVDCRERLCPKGADPLDDGKVNEVQVVTVDSTGGGTIGGTFKLSYKDLFGETWVTSAITASASDNSADVAAALKAIPNSVIEDVTVTHTASSNSGSVYSITFTHNPGNLELLTVDGTAVTNTYTAVATTASTEGTTVAQECSGRGLCDYDTGICKCFRGYRLDDCSSQHALAYTSGGI